MTAALRLVTAALRLASAGVSSNGGNGNGNRPNGNGQLARGSGSWGTARPSAVLLPGSGHASAAPPSSPYEPPCDAASDLATSAGSLGGEGETHARARVVVGSFGVHPRLASWLRDGEAAAEAGPSAPALGTSSSSAGVAAASNGGAGAAASSASYRGSARVSAGLPPSPRLASAAHAGPLSPPPPAPSPPPHAARADGSGGGGSDVMVTTVWSYGQVLRSLFHLPPCVFAPDVTTAQLTRRFRRAAVSVLAAHGMDLSCLVRARVWYDRAAVTLTDDEYGYCLPAGGGAVHGEEGGRARARSDGFAAPTALGAALQHAVNVEDELSPRDSVSGGGPAAREAAEAAAARATPPGPSAAARAAALAAAAGGALPEDKAHARALTPASSPQGSCSPCGLPAAPHSPAPPSPQPSSSATPAPAAHETAAVPAATPPAAGRTSGSGRGGGEGAFGAAPHFHVSWVPVLGVFTSAHGGSGSALLSGVSGGSGAGGGGAHRYVAVLELLAAHPAL